MDMKVKPKGLKEILQEDKSLSKKITCEEFLKVKSGFDDSGIEKVYEEYRKVLEKEN